MKATSTTPPKKPYQSPKLLVYGDLTEMTLGRRLMGNMDRPASIVRTGG